MVNLKKIKYIKPYSFSSFYMKISMRMKPKTLNVGDMMKSNLKSSKIALKEAICSLLLFVAFLLFLVLFYRKFKVSNQSDKCKTKHLANTEIPQRIKMKVLN